MFNWLKTKTKEIKLCKDCKWIIKEFNKYIDEEFLKCGNPKVCNVSKVTGNIDNYMCSVARAYECGKKAKYFEPKDE